MARSTLVMGSVLAFALASTAASAAYVQFDDRALFEAAGPAVTTNDLNSFVTDINLAPSVVVNAGDFTITGPAAGVARIDADGVGISSVNGSAYIQGIGAAGNSITFTFAGPVFAFGVDLFGINDSIERTFVDIDGSIFSLPVVAGNVGSFFGVRSDTAFTSVAFSLLEGEDAGLDNISFARTGTPVSAPATLALGLLALSLMAVVRRR